MFRALFFAVVSLPTRKGLPVQYCVTALFLLNARPDSVAYVIQ